MFIDGVAVDSIIMLSKKTRLVQAVVTFILVSEMLDQTDFLLLLIAGVL